MKESSSRNPEEHNSQWRHARVATALPCRRCAYDLRGLSVDGRCPECGLEVLATVQATVDPAASNLPRLRDPAGVANGLFWLMVALSGAALSLLVHAVIHRAPGLQRFAVGQIGPIAIHELVLLSGLLLLSGLWSTWRFRSPRGVETERRVRRDVRLLAVALSAVGFIGVLLWHRERTWAAMGLHATADEVVLVRSCYQLAMSLGAIVGWRALGGILETIGRRSREYRRARGGRQGIGPMTAATIGLALGLMGRIVGLHWPGLTTLWTFGTILAWICGFMLLVGLIYLVVNAWWIRQALRKPPPRLESLLAVPREAGGPGMPEDDRSHTEYFR